jgi:hypothetical protein
MKTDTKLVARKVTYHVTNISGVVDVYGSNNIIIGDINEDLLDNRFKHLKNTISMFAFHQLINEPTMRITETSETLLDPFIFFFKNITQFVVS